MRVKACPHNPFKISFAMVKNAFFVLLLPMLFAVNAAAQVYTFECVSAAAMTGDSCEGCTPWLIESRSFDGLVIWEDGDFWRWIEIPYTLKVRGDTLDIWEHTSPPSRLGRNVFYPDRVSILLGSTNYSTMAGFVDSVWCNRPSNTEALWYASDSISTAPIYYGDTVSIVGRNLAQVSFDSALQKFVINVDSIAGGTGTVTSVGAIAPAAGFTIAGSPITTAGDFTFTLADDLAAAEGITTFGLVTRIAANTWNTRFIAAGTGNITIDDADGVLGNPTINNTDPDQDETNELQAYAHSGVGSYTNTLSDGGGSFSLNAGTNITIARAGNAVTINSTATGTVIGAENGLNVVANNVRLGGNLITAATSIEGDGNELRFFDGKLSFSSWTGFANTPVQFMRLQGLEASPTTSATPVLDGIVEFRVHSAGGSDQSNSLTVGGYATDSDGIWMQSRSASVPNVKYPLSLQPRGGQMSVGRLNNLSSLVTFTSNGLTGSTAAGSTLLIENLEGSKISMALGNGLNNVSGELAFFSSDLLRLTNRNATNDVTGIRFAIGGETSDVAAMVKSSKSTLVRFGVGTTTPHSTLQSAGSFAAAVLETSGDPTWDETKHTVIYDASVNITWNIPTWAACNCLGREYLLHHGGSAGTITLAASVSKGNGGNFSTLVAGEWAYLIYSDTKLRGYLITSL